MSPTGLKPSGSFSRDGPTEGGVGAGDDAHGDLKHPEKIPEHQLSIHQRCSVESSVGVPPASTPVAESRPSLKLPKQASMDNAPHQQRQVDPGIMHRKHFSVDTSGSHVKQISMDTTTAHQKQPAVDTGVSHQKQSSMDITVSHQKQPSADSGPHSKQTATDTEVVQKPTATDTDVLQQQKQISLDSVPLVTKQDNCDAVVFLRQSSADATPPVMLVSPFRSPKLSKGVPVPILLNNSSEVGTQDQRSPLLSRQPLVRARSTQALDKTPQNEDKSVKHRSYTFAGELGVGGGVKEVAPTDVTLMSEGDLDDTLVSSEEDPLLVAISSPSFSTPGEGTSDSHVTPGSTVQLVAGPDLGTTGGSGSATPVRPFSVRTSSAGLRKDLSDNSISSRTRPRSMIETSCGMQHHMRELKTTPPDILAQLFWTACSLLESDYEDEFLLALKLFSKVRSCDMW